MSSFQAFSWVALLEEAVIVELLSLFLFHLGLAKSLPNSLIF